METIIAAKGFPDKRTGSRTLVLGAALGYSFEMAARFLVSLRATGYEGDVALLVYSRDDMDPVRLERLRVETVLVPRPRHPDHPLRRVPRVALRRLGLLPLGAKVSKAIPLPKSLAARFDESSSLLVHPPGTSRYVYYRKFLSGAASRYDRIVLSDVKDVIFQCDPATFPLRSTLNFFLESSRYTIGTEPQNAAWIKRLYGPAALDRIATLPISCSGTTIGEPAAVLDYLNALVDEMHRVIGRVIDPGFDQGVHNWLIRSGRFPDAAIEANGTGAVLTMGIEDPARCAATPEGDIFFPPHAVPAMVHQYNWHTAWDDHVKNRFRTPSQ